MQVWILFSYFSFAVASPQFETYENAYKVVIPSGPTISVISKCKQELNIEGGPWCDHTLTTGTKKIEIKSSRVSKFLLASGDKSISLVGYRPGCCSDSDFIHFFSEDMKDIGHIRYDGTHNKELSGSLKLSNFSKNSFVISESDLNKTEFDYKLVTKTNANTLVSEKLNIPPLKSECWFTIDKSFFSNNSLELTFVGHVCDPTSYKVICSKASSKWNCRPKT